MTPCLLVWPERIDANIAHMIERAGSPARLRPHCKTHKMDQVVRRLVAAGIDHHKAATVVEIELLCQSGAADVVLAGNPVGPTLSQLQRVMKTHPQIQFAVTADAEGPIRQLSEECDQTGTSAGIVLDLDVGQHRTGVDPDSGDALALYALIHELPHIHPAGLHIYDGHQHQSDIGERTTAVRQSWRPVYSLIERLNSSNLPVPEILCGGTPTFPVYAEFDDSRIRLSPGTCTLHDVGYGGNYSDLVFDVAAAIATRVVSSSVPGQLTLDAGTKSIASDPPLERRVYLPDLPDAQTLLHNEEHLTVRSDHAGRFEPGDLLLAFPGHICPTVALHEFAQVIEGEAITAQWPVARHRHLKD